jgi:hypothetical protein
MDPAYSVRVDNSLPLVGKGEEGKFVLVFLTVFVLHLPYVSFNPRRNLF